MVGHTHTHTQACTQTLMHPNRVSRRKLTGFVPALGGFVPALGDFLPALGAAFAPRWKHMEDVSVS